MVQGCQACLRIIKKPSEGIYFNAKCEPDDGSLMDKLTDCVPELLLDSVQNVTLCKTCLSSLTSAYDFRQQILETQQKIFGYLQQMPLDTKVDVGKIASYYNRLEMVTDKLETLDQENNSNSASMKIQHTCVLCLYSCVDECMLRQHMILHNSISAPYKCDECTFMFPTAELLLDHLAAHTKEKPYSCNLCDYLTDCHAKLKEHSCTHRHPFQCNRCWVRFYEASILQNHMKSEHNTQYQLIFKCDLCTYVSGNTAKIEYHIGKNHKKYSCSFCSIEFPSSSMLTKHLTLHRKAKTCDVQKQSLTNTYTFDDYVEDVYESSDDQIQNDEILESNEIPYVCDSMDVDVGASKTDCKNATNQNVGVPENDNPSKSYVCTFCSLTYPTSYALKLHLTVHVNVHIKDQSSTDSKIAVTPNLGSVRDTDLDTRSNLLTLQSVLPDSGNTVIAVETSNNNKRRRRRRRVRGTNTKYTKVFLGSNNFIRLKLNNAIEMGLASLPSKNECTDT